MALIRNMPGDPIALMAMGSQEKGSDKAVSSIYFEKMRQNLGLDKPWYVGYFVWLKNLTQGDLGRSLYDQKPVMEKIFERAGPTLYLSITSLVLGGRTDLEAWRYDYSVSYSHAEETEHGSIDPARFRQRFSGAGGSQGEVAFDYSDIGRPQYDFTVGESRFLDPSRYSFYRLECTTLSDSQDDEIAARFELEHRFIDIANPA